MMIDAMDADAWRCIMNAWLGSFSFSLMILLLLEMHRILSLLLAGLCSLGIFFLMRMFGQRVGQDPDPWSIRSIVPRCCFFA